MFNALYFNFETFLLNKSNIHHCEYFIGDTLEKKILEKTN